MPDLWSDVNFLPRACPCGVDAGEGIQLTVWLEARNLLALNVKTVVAAGLTSVAVGAAIKAGGGMTPGVARWIGGLIVAGERMGRAGRQDAERLLAETVEELQDIVAEARASRSAQTDG